LKVQKCIKLEKKTVKRPF